MKRTEELEKLQQLLSATRSRLKTFREQPWLHSLADNSTRAGYRLRPKWLRATDDMVSLTPVQWVDHAASEDGAGAAISRFVPREEVLALGDDFADSVRGELQQFVPILEAIYTGATPEALPPEPPPAPKPPLTLDWLAEQTLWSKERLAEVVDAMESGTRQIVLAGPPGTSKTWVARLLARFLTHDRPGAVHLVQFHPSYSYEEFIEGLRPVSKDGAISFERQDGFVLSIVKDMPSNVGPSVVVIDEMNRANLPKVFGELMYLFEYRDEPLDLQYSRGFRLPLELLFIGTMNTADRSIRSIDIALRRRFDVFECSPDSGVLARFYEQGPINEVADLVEGFEKLNAELTDEIDLHHTIGHAFFMTSKPMTRDRLAQIWRRKIGPLISEYFFDQPDRAASFTPSRFWAGL